MLGWKNHKLESRLPRRNINNLRCADDTTLMAESEEELKSLLMKVKEENEKVGLKLNIRKTKIMASSPTISWQIDGWTVETVADLIFSGSKITADGDCSHEIKRHLLLGRKVMANLDRILKSRYYFANKDPSSQFSSVQLLSRVWLFATPWTTARQASLSITNSKSPPKPMSIKSVMPSNHLILCRPLLLLPSIFPSIRVFSNVSALRIRWPKYWSFRVNISPTNERPGLISFRMDWLDLLAVQGTLKSFL